MRLHLIEMHKSLAGWMMESGKSTFSIPRWQLVDFAWLPFNWLPSFRALSIRMSDTWRGKN